MSLAPFAVLGLYGAYALGGWQASLAWALGVAFGFGDAAWIAMRAARKA